MMSAGTRFPLCISVPVVALCFIVGVGRHDTRLASCARTINVSSGGIGVKR